MKRVAKFEDEEPMSEKYKAFMKSVEDYVPPPAPILSADWMVGYLIGELIWQTKMPFLSTDLRTPSKLMIQVSEEDTAEHGRIGKELDVFYFNRNGKEDYKELPEYKQAWYNYIAFGNYLGDKYLPKTISYCVDFIIDHLNEEMVRNGMIRSLWDCDVCSYSTDEIKIEKDKYWTTVTLKWEPNPNNPI